MVKCGGLTVLGEVIADCELVRNRDEIEQVRIDDQRDRATMDVDTTKPLRVAGRKGCLSCEEEVQIQRRTKENCAGGRRSRGKEGVRGMQIRSEREEKQAKEALLSL